MLVVGAEGKFVVVASETDDGKCCSAREMPPLPEVSRSVAAATTAGLLRDDCRKRRGSAEATSRATYQASPGAVKTTAIATASCANAQRRSRA